MPDVKSVAIEFLPAALEIQETPPLPTSRYMVWTIFALLSAAALWVWFGSVDIVGVAHGKIIPAGRVIRVQAPQAAVVNTIAVDDGDHVVAGQQLLVLDDTAFKKDLVQLQHEHDLLQLDARRLEALSAAFIESDGVPLRSVPSLASEFSRVRVTDPRQIDLQDARMSEQMTRVRAELAMLADTDRRKRAELSTIQRRIEQLDAVLPLVSERTDALGRLLDRALAPRVQWLEVEEQRVMHITERDYQRSRLDVLDAELAELEQRRRQHIADLRSEWLGDLTAIRSRLAVMSEQKNKLQHALALANITAPVTGTVQDLSVHHTGAVVSPAQHLLRIVPDGSAMEIEAWVRNHDIGFVYTGQRADIKIETFPFTKYGTIPGRLSTVSRDAVEDESRGLIYAVRVAMDRATMQVADDWVKLTPGMAATAEFNLGERRIVEFLLSPLLRYRQEGLRER